jgi:2'-5' RNA ligase
VTSASVDSTLAIDVALLLPEHLVARTLALNRVLSADRQDALRLDGRHLPHITLAQQFTTTAKLPALLAAVARIARGQPALELRVPGVVARGATIALAIQRSARLQDLHESVMDALKAFEEPGGDVSSFLSDGEEIRPRDVEWVATYRARSSFGSYVPHITIGHGERQDPIEPIDFTADPLAACHLGRHCSCRVILQEWQLKLPARNRRSRG